MWRIPQRRRLHFTGPVPSAVPALFSLYRISRTCGIYMDFPPPSPLCLLSEVFSLRLFFPATVLTPSLASDTSRLTNTPFPPLTSRPSWFRCTGNHLISVRFNRLSRPRDHQDPPPPSWRWVISIPTTSLFTAEFLRC